MLWGAGWGSFWGSPEDWVVVLEANDFQTGCEIEFQPVSGYSQFYQLVVDGKNQGLPVYVADAQPYRLKGLYSNPGLNHSYSVVGMGPWSNGGFDATFAAILFLQSRAVSIHLEIQAVPDLFSVENAGGAQFSNWALAANYAISRFNTCRAVANRPTWGELDISMATVAGTHTVTASLNGAILAQGSRVGDGVVTLSEVNSSGVQLTVTLAYSADLAIGDAVLVAAFPEQYNVFYRNSGAWTGADFPAVTAASWASGVATVTIGAHSLAAGTQVFISGVKPTGYNGLWTITAVTATAVKFALATNPGAYVSGGMLTPPTAIVYDDGRSASYAFQSDTLASGTFYVVVHQISAEGEESSGTTNATVTLNAVPSPPTALALSNPIGDVIQWHSPNAGYTYNYYDSGSDGVLPATATGTHAAGSGTLTQGLAALVGFTGNRYVMVRSVSGGVESANSEALTISYVAGVAQLVRPNAPIPSQQISTNGLTLSVPFTLDTRNQAIAASSVKLFASPVGTPIDYTTPIGTLDVRTYTVSAATWAANVVTLTIGSHGFSAGDTIIVQGITPGGYNGVFVITATTGTQVKFAQAVNPGSYVSGGTVEGKQFTLAGLKIYGTVSGAVASAGQYDYAIRADSANGQSVNTDTYGAIRLTTVAMSDPVVTARPGV